MPTFELPPTGPIEVQSFVSVSHRPHAIGRVQDLYLTKDLHRGPRLALLGVFLVAMVAMTIVGALAQSRIPLLVGAPVGLLAAMAGVVLRNADDRARLCVDVCENGLRLTRGTKRYERREEEIFWIDITRLEVGQSESPDDGEELGARLSHGAGRAAGLPARLTGLADLVDRIQREIDDVAAARAKEKREREEARAAERAATPEEVS